MTHRFQKTSPPHAMTMKAFTDGAGALGHDTAT